MKTWVAVGAVLLSSAGAAAGAYAQETQDPVERQVLRIKEQLQLTDEQTAKVREIYKKQNDEFRAVLTDAQKTRLDEESQRRGRGQGGQGNQGLQGFRGGAFFPSTDDLKTQLGLSDEQVTKINEIRDGVRQEMRNFWQNRGRNGGNPAEEWNAWQTKAREESTKKVRDLLTDEQKPKFDEIVKTFQAQAPATGDGGGGRRGGGSSIDERVGRVMENLKIEDAKEADAIKALVKKVVEAMDKLEAWQRESRTKIDEASRNKELSDEAVGDRISEVIKGAREIEKELAAARKELAEVVTNRQELELLRRGVLR